MKFLINLFFLIRISAIKPDSLRTIFMRQNENFFNTLPDMPKYYEREKFTAKLKIETLLNLIYTNYAVRDTGFINELKANYLNSFLTNDKLLVDLNEPRIYKHLNRTWYQYCSQNQLECKKLCIKKEVINSYKKHWCLDHHYNRYKRSIIDKPISNDDLLDEILSDFSNANLNNNIIFIKSLADSLKTKSNENSFYQNGVAEVKGCQNVFCDINAECINTLDSYKCKCKSGYVGSGRQGGCFSGKFCSGRYCRQNGECYFKDALNGYKCKCALKCLNGGRCVMTKFKYECACPRNVTGFLCNETFEYNVFKQKLTEKFSDMTSSDSILLSDLIKFVEPEIDEQKFIKFYNVSLSNLKKTELVKFIKSNVKNFNLNPIKSSQNSDTFKKKLKNIFNSFMPLQSLYNYDLHEDHLDHFVSYV